MPAVQRVGDRNSAGGVIMNGNPTVLVNGRPIALLGSKVSPHPCCGALGCPPIHCNATTTAVNYTVLVNGKPIPVMNSKDTCSHPRQGGSLNVIIG